MRDDRIARVKVMVRAATGLVATACLLLAVGCDSSRPSLVPSNDSSTITGAGASPSVSATPTTSPSSTSRFPAGSVVAATDCSQTAVQKAVNKARSGEVVKVPAGSCRWPGRVTWRDKNIAVAGVGADRVKITCQECFEVVSSSATSANSRWRLTGLTLRGASPSGTVITIWDNVGSWHEGWRIDHMVLSYPGQGSGYGIFVGGATYGLIDHNTWVYGGGLGIINTGQMSDEWPGSASKPQGGYLAAQPLDLGTKKALYIENNTFVGSAPGGMAVYDTSSGGGRAVFRHNTVTAGIFYAHWTRDKEIGGGVYEIYNNRFIGNSRFNMYPIRVEGGTGVIFNNTVTGYSGRYVVVNERRGFFESSGAFGACDGTKPWDGNAGDPAAPGWPCLGQIGRAPGKSIAQIRAGAKQDSAPLYLWNNGSQDGCRAGATCVDSVGISVWDGSARARAYVTTARHPNGEVDVVLNGSRAKSGYRPYLYPHPLNR